MIHPNQIKCWLSVVFSLTFLCMGWSSHAQIGLQLALFSTDSTQKVLVSPTPNRNYFPQSSSNYTQPLLNEFSISFSAPKAYCYQDLAFFCKVEVQLEKNVKFPMKFRLGSVQHVDWLEGKRDFQP